MPPCPRCPFNGGNPFQPTAASAGSEGPLTGEVRRMALHRRSHQPRPLFGSRQAYYPDHRFFMMIAHYLTPSRPVCQFLFCIFQCFSSFFMSAPPEPPVPGAGLPMSTKCLPKNGVKALGHKGLEKPPWRAGLPDVYHFHFFTSKAPVLMDFLRFFATFKPYARGVTRPQRGRKVEKPRKIWIK